MKRQLVLVLAVVLLIGLVQPCQAELYFFDDFNSENGGIGSYNFDGFTNGNDFQHLISRVSYQLYVCCDLHSDIGQL